MTTQRTVEIRTSVYERLKKVAEQERKSLTASLEEIVLAFIQKNSPHKS